MIQEITILTNTGIPLFYYNFRSKFNKNYDYNLIASYFDQLCRFTKYEFKESLNTLKMNKSVFYFYTHPESSYHLIFKCNSKVDEKKIKKKAIDACAREIFERFITKFKKELTHFSGNIGLFKSFSNDIEEIIRSRGVKSLRSNLF